MTATTHSADCWRWHHGCAVARLRDHAAALQATRTALADALSRYDRAWQVPGPDGPEHFTARPVSTEQLDAWHRVLDRTELAARDVAGADVTPDPAAPATTTT